MKHSRATLIDGDLDAPRAKVKVRNKVNKYNEQSVCLCDLISRGYIYINCWISGRDMAIIIMHSGRATQIRRVDLPLKAREWFMMHTRATIMHK